MDASRVGGVLLVLAAVSVGRAQDGTGATGPSRQASVGEGAQTLAEEAGDAPPSIATLGDYLGQMALRLKFHYTIEDRRDAQGAPSDVLMTDVHRFDLATPVAILDDLIVRANDHLRGVRLVRSRRVPEVVHVIAQPAGTSESALDRRVTIDYSGPLNRLPSRLGSLVDGQIQAQSAHSLRDLSWGDLTTEVRIVAKEESVRDILTRAVPLDSYPPLLWVARPRFGPSAVEIDYRGPKLSEATSLYLEQGLDGYLEHIGGRLNCYFTFEDDRSEGHRDGPWIRDLELFSLEDDASTIEELVASLDRMFNVRPTETSPGAREERVRVVRSRLYPRTIHLIQASLARARRYPMDERASLTFQGPLDEVPNRLGRLFEGRIAPGTSPTVPRVGGAVPTVRVEFEDATVREILTGARPLDGAGHLLWQAGRLHHTDGIRVFVAYFATERPSGEVPIDSGLSTQARPDSAIPPGADPFGVSADKSP